MGRLIRIKAIDLIGCHRYFVAGTASRRFGCKGFLAALWLLAQASCAPDVSLRPMPPMSPAAAGTSDSAISEAAITDEVVRLRSTLRQAVPQPTADDPENGQAWISLTQRAIAAAPFKLERTQLLIVVDRNPRIQELRIILARLGSRPWEVIGGSKVSTGQAGRRGYFITPVGVFLHAADILDYRALGTFNENHIRGLGLKGMRVWDFGWQTAEKGWTAQDESGEIRLLMHATDPDYLEQRLGRPASKGCIQIPATMNRFLDIHGVLDADYERAVPDDLVTVGSFSRSASPPRSRAMP
jgi:hypothetical protein